MQAAGFGGTSNGTASGAGLVAIYLVNINVGNWATLVDYDNLGYGYFSTDLSNQTNPVIVNVGGGLEATGQIISQSASGNTNQLAAIDETSDKAVRISTMSNCGFINASNAANNASEPLVLAPSGTNVTIGTTTVGSDALDVTGTIGATTSIYAPTINATSLFEANGTAGVSAGPFTSVSSITTTFGLVTALSGSSDERLKNSTPFVDGLDVIAKITPVRYTLNAVGQKQTGLTADLVQVGFLAQNVQQAIPEAITGTELSRTDKKTEYLCLDTKPIIAALVNAVQQLNGTVQQLNSKMELLESKLRAI